MKLEELKFLLTKYSLTPNKIRGQNFLISDEVLEDIVEAADIKPGDLVLEVGPGLGALTQALLGKAKQVVALEVDKNFAKALGKLTEINNNLEVIFQDVMSFSDEQLVDMLKKYKVKNYKIVANLPYYLTSKFLQKFITAQKPPLGMTLMVQREVADRVVDTKKQSLLSLSVAFYAQSKIGSAVSKENFYPRPQVDSAILKIYDISPWIYDVDQKRAWQIIKRGFACKRKKLFNNLLSDTDINKEKLQTIFDKIGLDSNIRAEKLSLKNWLELIKNL